MPLRSTDALEFSGLLEVLSRYVASPLGEWQIEELRAEPLRPSQQSAEESLAEVAEAIDFLEQAKAEAGRSGTPVTPQFNGLRDMRPAVLVGALRHVLGQVVIEKRTHFIAKGDLLRCQFQFHSCYS